MNQKIFVSNPSDESLASQLISLYQSFKGVEKNRPLVFDLNSVRRPQPFLLLPLVAYAEKTGSSFDTAALSASTRSYFQTIAFPKGVDSLSEFQLNKTCVPIGVLRTTVPIREREGLESAFSKMVKNVSQTVEGATTALYYPIGELVTNIFEHSQADVGYFFGQYYPKKRYLDICIVDAGRGIAKSYETEKHLIYSDEEAIIEAMKGRSTKPSDERGYGIHTSKNLVTKGLGGEFVLVSGSAAFLADKNRERLVKLPNFYWQGTILSLRIPKLGQPINIAPYLE